MSCRNGSRIRDGFMDTDRRWNSSVCSPVCTRYTASTRLRFELRALSFVVLSVVAMCVNIVPKAYVRNRMRPPGGPVERRPHHGVVPPIRAPTTRAYRTIYSARPDVKL